MNALPTREAWLNDPHETGKMLLNVLYGAIVALALVAVVAVLWLAMVDWPSPKPTITATALPPVVCPISLPAPAKASKPAKKTPEIIAAQAMSTPARVINNPETAPITPAEQDFANSLQNFERKIP